MKSKRRKGRMLLLLFSSLLCGALLYLFYGSVAVTSSVSSSNASENFQQKQVDLSSSRHDAESRVNKADANQRLSRTQCIDPQTDLDNLAEFKPIPNFMIVGVQKGGTSALRGILIEHPNLIATKKFEPHYFDKQLAIYLRQKYNASISEIKPSWICDLQRNYQQTIFYPRALEEAHSDWYFFEKTPSYILDPDIPSLISMICPWRPKILIILRNPIDRAFSHYKMEREKLRVKGDFESAINDEISVMQSMGLTNAPILPTGSLTSASTSTLEVFVDQLETEQFRVPALEQTVSDSSHKQLMTEMKNTNFLQRGMYATQIGRWLDYFGLKDALLVLKFEDLKDNPRTFYQQVLEFVGAPYFELKPEDLVKSYKTRGVSRQKGMVHPPLSNATRQYLEMFFGPYNNMLSELLGQKFY